MAGSSPAWGSTKQIVSGGTPKSTQAEYYNGNLPSALMQKVKDCWCMQQNANNKTDFAT